MKKVILYECEDGKRFNTVSEAEKYEALMSSINLFMRDLNNPPKSDNSRVRQTPDCVAYIKHNVFKVLGNYYCCNGLYPWKKQNFDEVSSGNRHISHLDQIIEHEPFVRSILCRFRCIVDGYEYAQQGYAKFSDKFVNNVLPDNINVLT